MSAARSISKKVLHNAFVYAKLCNDTTVKLMTAYVQHLAFNLN